jgi:hypothetical protein
VELDETSLIVRMRHLQEKTVGGSVPDLDELRSLVTSS